MRDDRGKACKSRLTHGLKTMATSNPELFRRIRRKVFVSTARSHFRIRRVACVLAIATICFVPLYFLMRVAESMFNLSASLGTSVEFATIILFWGTLLFAFLSAFLYHRYVGSRVIPRVLSSLGLCGACAYRLRAVPPDTDGCTVCPECGSAWKLPTTESRTDA